MNDVLVESIIGEIRKLCDQDDINKVIDAVKLQMNYVSRKNIRNVVVGSTVQFTARSGQVVQGKVSKVNQKTVEVKVNHNPGGWGMTTYKVPAGLLKVM